MSIGTAQEISQRTRLDLFRQMVRMRKLEKRAYDLFMKNLVKGTSHLSLGQEAIAAAFGWLCAATSLEEVGYALEPD